MLDRVAALAVDDVLHLLEKIRGDPGLALPQGPSACLPPHSTAVKDWMLDDHTKGSWLVVMLTAINNNKEEYRHG